MFKIKQNLYKKSRGFTLIELLVVIAIIGILASVVLSSLSSARAGARDAQRLSEARQLQTSLELFRNNNDGSYPCWNGSVTANDTCAAQVQLTPNSATTHPLFRAAINWQHRADGARLRYRIRSTTNNDNNPDRNSYTILVQLESVRRNGAGQTIAANGWCKINEGLGHPDYANDTTYPPCF